MKRSECQTANASSGAFSVSLTKETAVKIKYTRQQRKWLRRHIQLLIRCGLVEKAEIWKKRIRNH